MATRTFIFLALLGLSAATASMRGTSSPVIVRRRAPGQGKPKNIVELASATADLSTLVTAVKAAGLVDTLSAAGPFTVFAPTNEAFAKLPKTTLTYLLDPHNVADLKKVLTYHVVAAAAFAKDLTDGEAVKTVEGSSVTAHVSSAGVKINDASVTTADVAAANGVVHIIDAVLLPPDLPTPPAPAPAPAPGKQNI